MSFLGKLFAPQRPLSCAYIHHQLTLMESRIMAGQAELDAKLEELKAAVAKELAQLAAAVAASAPDLSPQVAKVQEAIDALNSDDPAS